MVEGFITNRILVLSKHENIHYHIPLDQIDNKTGANS